MNTILIADDESDVRSYLGAALGCRGYQVEYAENGEDVLERLFSEGPDISLILLDLLMPLKDGIEALEQLRRTRPELPVIILSGASSPVNIVNAMKIGATDFLAKPINHEDLFRAIEKALSATVGEFQLNGAANPADPSAPALGAWSQKLELLLASVGTSDVPVLLQGETGVGKEVLARKLHARSPRAGRPFLKLNCAALPSELVESELFGYERGAFTGAFKSTPGKFEMANEGTILLDEIGDMDFKLQAKLLQVVQDHEFLRLGAKEPSKVDVRVMAATHCDLEEAIHKGRFREDLYYRLNIIDIHIPPLRDRKDEILPLAEFFIQTHATANQPALAIPQKLRQALHEHLWPGNIRELENVVRKFLVLRNADLVAEELRRQARKRSNARPLWQSSPYAPAEGVSERFEARTPPRDDIAQDGARRPPQQLNALENGSSNVHARANEQAPPPDPSILKHVDNVYRAAEAEAIVKALNASLWNRKQAAALLKIDYKALLYKMKKLRIGEGTGVQDT